MTDKHMSDNELLQLMLDCRYASGELADHARMKLVREFGAYRKEKADLENENKRLKDVNERLLNGWIKDRAMRFRLLNSEIHGDWDALARELIEDELSKAPKPPEKPKEAK